MGSFLSKRNISNRRSSKSTSNMQGEDVVDTKYKNVFADAENALSLPDSPILGLKCKHSFPKKTTGNSHLCSKCGFSVKSPNQILKRINAENKRKEELKLKLKAQMITWENESGKCVSMSIQGQENEDFELSDSFIKYPPIKPGLIPVDTLPQCLNDKSGNVYQGQQQNLETINQDENYFIENPQAKFMTIRRGRPRVRYLLHNEFEF